MKPVGLGLIGLGYWGRILATSLGQVPDTRLTAVAAGNSGKYLDQIQADCRIFADWREILDQADVAGVIVATPPALHYQMAMAALEHSLPVFLEKPMALTARDAHALAQLAQVRKAIFHVDHIDLFNPAWEALKKNLGMIGRINRVEARFGGPIPVRHAIPSLWDWGGHPIALCIDLCGPPTEMHMLEIAEQSPGTRGNVRFHLAWPADITAEITVGDSFETAERSLEVTGDKGILRYDDKAADKLTFTSDVTRTAMAFGDGRPVSRALARFKDAIREGNPSFDDATLGSNVITVLEKLSGPIEN